MRMQCCARFSCPYTQQACTGLGAGAGRPTHITPGISQLGYRQSFSPKFADGAVERALQQWRSHCIARLWSSARAKRALTSEAARHVPHATRPPSLASLSSAIAAADALGTGGDGAGRWRASTRGSRGKETKGRAGWRSGRQRMSRRVHGWTVMRTGGTGNARLPSGFLHAACVVLPSVGERPVSPFTACTPSALSLV